MKGEKLECDRQATGETGGLAKRVKAAGCIRIQRVEKKLKSELLLRCIRLDIRRNRRSVISKIDKGMGHTVWDGKSYERVAHWTGERRQAAI